MTNLTTLLFCPLALLPDPLYPEVMRGTAAEDNGEDWSRPWRREKKFPTKEVEEEVEVEVEDMPREVLGAGEEVEEEEEEFRDWCIITLQSEIKL